jgi:tetratricopeptide (TPR) repeat protein
MSPDVLGSEEGIRLAVTLAAALFVAGYAADAAELCDRAIAESERLSSPVARASAYWNASVIRGDRGELTEALALAGRALALLEETERVRDTGRLRHQLAWILLRSDPPQVEAAVDHLTRARTELDWSEASAADRAVNDHLRAHASFLAGDLDRAREVATGLVARIQGELPLRTAYVMTLLGQVAWAEGDRDEARTWYRRAVAELTAAGADREAAQLWFDLGTLAEAAGLADEARDAFRRSAASTGITSRLPVVPTTTPRTPTPRPGA